MTTDELLRQYEYRIESRPVKGEATWRLRNTRIVHAQSLALERIRVWESRNAKRIRRK